MPSTTLKIVVYIVLFILTIATIKTVIPSSGASKPCLLGYKATCSFTPISTMILTAVAIAVFFFSRNMLLT